MAATRTQVTGPVVLPDGSNAPDGAVIVFSLPDWDKDGATIVMSGPVEAVVSSGAINASLWRTTAGGRALTYDVAYRYFNEADQRWVSKPIGKAALSGAGPVTLASILSLPAPVPNVPDALAQALGAAEAAKQERIKSEQIRSDVEGATALGGWFDTIAAGRAAVANNIQFGVRAGGTDGLTRPTIYRRDSSATQTLIVEMPRGSEVDSLSASFGARFKSLPGFGILASLVTPSNRRTAMEVRQSDGAWTDWSMTLWGRRLSLAFIPDAFRTTLAGDLRGRMGYTVRRAPGFLFAICTPSGRRSWIEARSSNGRMTDYAARVVAEDITPYLPDLAGAARPALDGTWEHPSGDVVPYELDRRIFVSHGSSSAERSADDYAAIIEGHGAEFVSLAKGGALIGQNIAQLGVIPPKVTVTGGSIPTSGAVAVTINVTANANFGSVPGTLAGVHGTLAWSTANSRMEFTRSASGSAVSVSGATDFYPDAIKYRACGLSLESGKNNISAGITAAQLRAETRKVVEWSAPFVNHTIVWSHFPNAAYSSAQIAVCADIEDMLIEDYGNRVIAQYAWFRSEQLWDDLATVGYSPTSDDLADQAAGLVPRGLMAGDGAHLTPDAYAWRAQFLFAPKLRELQIYL